jgi:hypothetical protein
MFVVEHATYWIVVEGLNPKKIETLSLQSYQILKDAQNVVHQTIHKR